MTDSGRTVDFMSADFLRIEEGARRRALGHSRLRAPLPVLRATARGRRGRLAPTSNVAKGEAALFAERNVHVEWTETRASSP
jgi:hypothetical protein